MGCQDRGTDGGRSRGLGTGGNRFVIVGLAIRRHGLVTHFFHIRSHRLHRGSKLVACFWCGDLFLAARTGVVIAAISIGGYGLVVVAGLGSGDWFVVAFALVGSYGLIVGTLNILGVAGIARIACVAWCRRDNG